MASAVTKGFSASSSTQETGKGQFNGKDVIIYTPITGNPTHLGHFNLAQRAAKEVQNAGAVACRVFFSLASQSYLESKKSADFLKLKEPQRQRLLELTIQDSKEYFPEGVKTEFCGFEDEGHHVQKYRDIQTQYPKSFVVLAAGADLQSRMSNWSSQKQFFAIIQNRGTDRRSSLNRIALEESKQFSHVSSTEIRKAVLAGRQPEGIGPLAATYLKQLVPLPFRFQEIQTRFPVYEDLRAEIARRFPTLECQTTDLHVTPHPDFGDLVVPVAILEPTLTTPKLENLSKVFNLANRISINRSYPDPRHDIKFEVYGTTYTCHRPNHNGTHSYRQVRYLEILLDLTAKYGRQEAKAFCQKLTEKDLVNLKLATFFLRAGRLDETDSQLKGSDNKLLRSSQLYERYASGMGISEDQIGFAKQLILDNCCPSAKLDYKAVGQWNPKAFLQTLLTLAHEIDLVRCFPNFEQRTKPSLMRNLSGWVLDATTNVEVVAASLQKFGIEANTLVGQQVAVESKPYDRQRFFVHSTYGEYCRYRLSKLEFSIDSSSSSPSAASPAKPPQSTPSTPKKESCILM